MYRSVHGINPAGVHKIGVVQAAGLNKFTLVGLNFPVDGSEVLNANAPTIATTKDKMKLNFFMTN